MIVISTLNGESIYVNPKSIGKFSIKLENGQNYIHMTRKNGGFLWDGYSESFITDESIINAMKGISTLRFIECKEKECEN